MVDPYEQQAENTAGEYWELWETGEMHVSRKPTESASGGDAEVSEIGIVEVECESFDGDSGVGV